MMGVKKCVIASLGFDVDFVLRRLKSEDVVRLVCYGIRVDDASWSRVEKAFSLIKHYCEAVKISCVLEGVSLGSLVSEVRGVLERELGGCGFLELFLTGGPRVAVVGGLLAALTLPVSLADRVNVRVEGETFDAKLEFNAGVLVKYLMLDDDSRKVIEAVLEPSKTSDVARKASIPMSKALRRVRNLAASRILKEVEEKVYVAREDMRGLISLIRR